MRNRNLTIGAMVGLLLAGLALAAYFIFGNSPRPTPPVNLPQQATLPDAPVANAPLAEKPPDNREAPPANTEKQPANGEGTGPGEIIAKPDTPETPKSNWVAVTEQRTATGRVIYRETSRPAPGAVVTPEVPALASWQRQQPRPNVGRPATTVTGEAVTDGSGEFSLIITVTFYVGTDQPQVFEGALNLVAKLAGYAPGRSRTMDAMDKSDWSAIEIGLTFPAAARGRVVDAVTSNGIEGAIVEFVAAMRTGGILAPTHLRTDKEGYFAVTDLPADEYTVNVSADGYASFSGWFDPGGRRDLSRGGDTDLGEFALLKAGSITGKVVRPDGKPAVAATVSAEWAGSAVWMGGRQVRTDDEGVFIVDGLKPGQYNLEIKLSSVGTLDVGGIALAAGEAKNVGTLTLDQGITLSGRVQDAQGAPVAGASLTVKLPGTGGYFDGFSESAAAGFSAKDGTFSLTGLVAGSVQLTTTKSGLATNVVQLALSADMSVVVTLQMPGAIIGRVLLQDGGVPEGVRLVAANHESSEYTAARTYGAWMLGGGVFPAQDGSFRAADLEPGTWTLHVIRNNDIVAKVEGLKIESGKEIDVGLITLQSPGSAQIRVTNNGAPVPDIRISLSSSLGWGGINLSGITDNTGTVLIENVPAGDYFVATPMDEGSFDTENMRTRRLKVKANERAEFHLELEARTGATLSGRVTLNQRVYFKEITVAGQGEVRSVLKNARIAEGGFFEIRGLRPGRYVIHCRAESSDLTFRDEVTITDEDASFDRDFSSYAISGKVVLPEGKADLVRSVTVRITTLGTGADSFSQWTAGQCECDAAGAFKFPHVQAGRYRVTAALDGAGTASADVTVDGGDTAGLQLVITDNVGQVRVRVTKIHGDMAGMMFGQVQLIDADGNAVIMADDNAGMFMLGRVEPIDIPLVAAGTYTVRIRAMSCIGREYPGVKVVKGETTELSVEITVGATLSVTFTNEGITQAQLDAAKVRYIDEKGAELPVESNIWDAWSNQTVPEAPTLTARYIPASVKTVRVKVAGFQEVSIPISAEPGKQLTSQQTLQPE